MKTLIPRQSSLILIGPNSLQVPIAYNIKVEELKSQGLEEEELNQKLELLKVSRNQN